MFGVEYCWVVQQEDVFGWALEKKTVLKVWCKFQASLDLNQKFVKCTICVKNKYNIN